MAAPAHESTSGCGCGTERSKGVGAPPANPDCSSKTPQNRGNPPYYFLYYLYGFGLMDLLERAEIGRS
jgi:hypothetical protein